MVLICIDLIKKPDERAVVCFLTAYEEYYDEFREGLPINGYEVFHSQTNSHGERSDHIA